MSTTQAGQKIRDAMTLFSENPSPIEAQYQEAYEETATLLGGARRDLLHRSRGSIAAASATPNHAFWMEVVPGDGVEPPTLRFSVACSTN